MNRERSKSDPHIARKLAELAQEVQEDPFPLPRIEDVALTARSRLEALRDELDPQDLVSAPTTNDPLTGVHVNDEFVRQDISPIVQRLLQRTNRIVQMVEGVPFGYGASGDDDDEDKEAEVLIVVEDLSDDYTFVVENHAQMQEVWDTAHPRIREGMREYAAFTKEQIIGRFIAYIEEYAPAE